MMNLLKIVFLLLFFLSASSNAVEYFGKYSGAVKAEWLDDGRIMKFLDGFLYEDPNGMLWKAPKDSLVDGASIPTFAWSIFGAPFSGKYRNASVVHDIACQEKNRTWEVVHLTFYYAMSASGVGTFMSKAMYAAVYHFGPRWPIKQKILIKEATTKKIAIPAEYKTVSEEVMVRAAHKKWEEKPAGPMAHGTKKVLVDVPAQYRTVSKQILVSPEKVEERLIPPQFSLVVISPLPKYLDESSFNKLVEKLQNDKDSLSLAEIREYE